VTVAPIPPQGLSSSPLLNDTRVFYQVLKHPAPLAGMAFPKGKPWAALQAAGFTSVVCLTDQIPPYNPDPLRVLYSGAFRDLYGGLQPRDPVREAEMLSEVVGEIRRELSAGRGVVIHCQGGTGRTGTVIACTLHSMGLPREEVLKYMELVNRSRQKSPDWHGWPESAWQGQQVERFSSKN
jgi:hypothetical protein